MFCTDGSKLRHRGITQPLQEQPHLESRAGKWSQQGTALFLPPGSAGKSMLCLQVWKTTSKATSSLSQLTTLSQHSPSPSSGYRQEARASSHWGELEKWENPSALYPSEPTNTLTFWVPQQGKLPRWEVHSSSWQVTHVSHRRLQQQGMLFKYHADLQEPDGVSLASQQSSQREQRGHGRAEVLLPARRDEAMKVHRDRPSEIQLAQGTQHTQQGLLLPQNQEKPGVRRGSSKRFSAARVCGAGLSPAARWVCGRTPWSSLAPEGIPEATRARWAVSRGACALGRAPGPAPQPWEPHTPRCLCSRCLHTRI